MTRFHIGVLSGIENDVEFKWKTSSYIYYNIPDYPSVLEMPAQGTQLIRIEYTDMKVDINSEVNMVDFNTFISGVGGALGLFLGFSIIDTLIYFFTKIFK